MWVLFYVVTDSTCLRCLVLSVAMVLSFPVYFPKNQIQIREIHQKSSLSDSETTYLGTSIEISDDLNGFHKFTKEIKSGVVFTMYTKARLLGIDLDLISLWNKDVPTKLFIHTAYYGSWAGRNNLSEELESIILANLLYGEQTNLVLVNWTKAASTIRIENCTSTINQIGEDVATFLMRLKRAGSIDLWNDIHLIGFGIGAHIAGITGTKVQKLDGGSKLGRITGLDPTSDLDAIDYSTAIDSGFTLDISDANFVDIIHCNVGLALASTTIRGHADFYPNGGMHQPDCDKKVDGYCSHERCLEFYIISLNYNMQACQCQNWSAFKNSKCDCNSQPVIYMGETCSTTARGRYYLRVP